MKSLRDQVTAAKCELALRRAVYPKRIALGALKPNVAAHETECMEAIVSTLERALMLAEAGDEMTARWRAEQAKRAEAAQEQQRSKDDFDL